VGRFRVGTVLTALFVITLIWVCSSGIRVESAQNSTPTPSPTFSPVEQPWVQKLAAQRQTYDQQHPVFDCARDREWATDTLVDLLAQPETQSWTLDRLESVYEHGVEWGISLNDEQEGVILGSRTRPECAYGSRYNYAYSDLYVFNRSGDAWLLGQGVILSARWHNGGWDVFVNTSVEEGQLYFLVLWRIELLDGQWQIVDGVHLDYGDTLIGRTRVDFAEDTGQISVYYERVVWSPPPCQFNNEVSWYSGGEAVERVYGWSGEEYVQIGDTQRQVLFNMFNEYGENGEFTGYIVLDNWQDYCIDGEEKQP